MGKGLLAAAFAEVNAAFAAAFAAALLFAAILVAEVARDGREREGQDGSR